MKAVLAPSKAITHIQNTAPGPPTKMALATPAKLPVPTLDERLMAKAWKEDTFFPVDVDSVGVHRLRSIVGSIDLLLFTQWHSLLPVVCVSSCRKYFFIYIGITSLKGIA